VGLTLLFTAGMILRWTVIGSPTVVSGRVESINTYDTKSGRRHYLIVALPGERVRLNWLGSVGCGVGSQIRLRRLQHLLGPEYIVASGSCATP
jgi:hypothetical protein